MNRRGWVVLAAMFLTGMVPGQPFEAQQEGEPVSIGTYRVMHSKILNEDRTLLIHLPRGYEHSKSSYPVIYMLYGDHEAQAPRALGDALADLQPALRRSCGRAGPRDPARSSALRAQLALSVR